MHPRIPHTDAGRTGITLLEVLVAAGILVIGLVSVAALLPAAGALLGEAVTADRAATLATNAPSDLEFIKTLKAIQFSTTNRTVMVGDVFLAAPFTAAPFTTGYRRIASIAKTTSDNEAYGRTWYVATATPLATSGNITSGMPARVSVAVLRSVPPTVRTTSISLTRVSLGVYRFTSNGTAALRTANELDRKIYLAPCAWVMTPKSSIVRWLHIGSSWPTYSAGTGGAVGAIANSFVSFSDPAAATAAESPVNIISVYAISGVDRVEERIVPLD